MDKNTRITLYITASHLPISFSWDKTEIKVWWAAFLKRSPGSFYQRKLLCWGPSGLRYEWPHGIARGPSLPLFLLALSLSLSPVNSRNSPAPPLNGRGASAPGSCLLNTKRNRDPWSSGWTTNTPASTKHQAIWGQLFYLSPPCLSSLLTFFSQTKLILKVHLLDL